MLRRGNEILQRSGPSSLLRLRSVSMRQKRSGRHGRTGPSDKPHARVGHQPRSIRVYLCAAVRTCARCARFPRPLHCTRALVRALSRGRAIRSGDPWAAPKLRCRQSDTRAGHRNRAACARIAATTPRPRPRAVTVHAANSGGGGTETGRAGRRIAAIRRCGPVGAAGRCTRGGIG